MSRRGRELAAEYVQAIVSATGITKAAGGMLSVPLLMEVVGPLAEVIIEQDKAVTRTAKQARRTNRRLRKHARVLAAIASPAPSTAPSPMRLPQREQVPMRAGEWTTSLTRIAQPKPMNGHHHQAEDRTEPGTPPAGHPG